MGEPYDPADQAYDLFPLKRAVRFGAVFVEAAACRPFGECRNNDNMVYAEKFFAPDGFPRPRGSGSTAETGVGTGGGMRGDAARAAESGNGVGGAGGGGGANDHSNNSNASIVTAAARAVSSVTTVIAEDETVFFAQQLPVRLNRWDPCHVGKGTVGRAAKVPKAEEFDLATCAREQYLRVDDRTGEVFFDGGWFGEPPPHSQSSPPLLPGVVATEETTTPLPTAPGRAAAGGGGRGGGGRARGNGGAAAVSAARQGGANRYTIDGALHKDLVS